ncbi:MAG: O-antigen ligase family protein [Ignavibacteria bacterium]|nr:O-antigen ligase family protein [Ignavibacteria bacterium]
MEYGKYKHRIENIILIFFAVHISAVSFSIAVASISFGIWGGLWLINLVMTKRNPFNNHSFPELKFVYLFLLIYVIFEILSRFFAVIPEGALAGLKRLLLLLIFVASVDITDKTKKLESIITVVLIVFSVISTYEIVRFMVEYINAGFEINIIDTRLGYFSHPITTGEVKMLVFVLLIPLLFIKGREFRNKKIILSFLLLPILISLFLTFSRNVILAVIVCFIITGLFMSRKTLIATIIIVIAIFLFSPPQLKERLTSSFNPEHETNKPRLIMWKTGLKMFSDHIWTGVGDNEFIGVYKMYRQPEFTGEGSHMHNNYMMILVTTGLFGFIGYCGFMITLFIKQIKLYRRESNDKFKKLIFGSILAFIAFNLSGIFEWNFGDWEVLSVFLFIISIPFIIFNIDKLKIINDGKR